MTRLHRRGPNRIGLTRIGARKKFVRMLRHRPRANGGRSDEPGRLGMEVAILTPVRLLADGLSTCLVGHCDISCVLVVRNLADLREACTKKPIDVAVIDVTHGIDIEEVRLLAIAVPGTALIALGLVEQHQEVIRFGRAGFAGYVTRDAGIDVLAKAISDAMLGRLACPAEISAGLMRALFRTAPESGSAVGDAALTRREGDVLHLIGQGLSNKEIARELDLSVSTVKHHVHHILDKLRLPRRAQAMRHVRSAPWLAARSFGNSSPTPGTRGRDS
jgi:two-component system nitrate/nitrite response regulator NarL